MPVVRRIACTVRSILSYGDGVYTVELDPELPLPRFKPGQFLHLALDPFDGTEHWPDSRIFSIASGPDDQDRLEITYAVKGAFTSRMERELAVGRRVWVKLPYGEFLVDPDRDAVLFAGGTGATAFAALLRSVGNGSHHRIHLFYGARHPELFIYRSDAEAAAKASPACTFTLVDEGQQGRLSVDRAWPTIGDLDRPVFYLSGPPQMLSSLSDQLRRHGVPEADIRIDAWE
jgi:ferredoxin-NADP reductase